MKYSNDKLKPSFRLKYTKVLCLKSIFFLLVASCSFGQPIDNDYSAVDPIKTIEKAIVVGAQKLDGILSLLDNKSVGVVGNQSSLVDGIHLVDTLLHSGIKVKRIFSPEHGFRGDADAGEHISSQTDKKTGLSIVSLYGKNKKPHPSQLIGLDVLIFDIQDVGVRFYTYISTLHYVMEACAENHITLIILDRPNPNGHYIDGPILDPTYKSFVGMHPIPIVHGMTIAEYARMINGEKWLKNKIQCDLTVVSCDNYSHSRNYSLPVPPSPNLRSDISIQLYPSLCLLESTTVTLGRGTSSPFECYGHPDFLKTEFAFIPRSGPGSKKPKHQDKLCNGFYLNNSNYERMYKLDLSFMLNAKKQLNGKLFVDRSKFFNLLAGNNILLQQVESGMSEDEIRATWKEGLDEFSLVRAKYLMYD
ncbi:MAG: DUF1343 domain-containing protein [Crocinitomicaceae bacterium]